MYLRPTACLLVPVHIVYIDVAGIIAGSRHIESIIKLPEALPGSLQPAMGAFTVLTR